jgi:hypothetical protein
VATADTGWRPSDWELQELAATDHGENNRLNQAAFSLGMLVADGELDQATAEQQLKQAALGMGLHPAEIERTIVSGLGRGEQLRRVAPHSCAEGEASGRAPGCGSQERLFGERSGTCWPSAGGSCYLNGHPGVSTPITQPGN